MELHQQVVEVVVVVILVHQLEMVLLEDQAVEPVHMELPQLEQEEQEIHLLYHLLKEMQVEVFHQAE